LIDDCEAEVENLRRAVARHEDVLRLQVAMHDPAIVRGTERVCDLGREAQNDIQGKRAADTTREAPSRPISPSL